MGRCIPLFAVGGAGFFPFLGIQLRLGWTRGDQRGGQCLFDRGGDAGDVGVVGDVSGDVGGGDVWRCGRCGRCGVAMWGVDVRRCVKYTLSTPLVGGPTPILPGMDPVCATMARTYETNPLD